MRLEGFRPQALDNWAIDLMSMGNKSSGRRKEIGRADLNEHQNRFVEVLIIQSLCEALWRNGYREVDFSLTGDENWKSDRIQERTGTRIYRRYRMYQKDPRLTG